jgi:IS5 family transposase
LDDLVRGDHPYRKIISKVNFRSLARQLESLYSENAGAKGYPPEVAFKCLLLQFWEDLSDREMECGLKDHIAMKWFCGFGLVDKTPDHSWFGKFRQRIGAEKLAEMFNYVNRKLRKEGLISDVFTFVDSSTVIAKVSLWEERDKAKKDGIDKLNNDLVGKYSSDPDARFGCKGKNKFWHGYKQHLSIDMKQGFVKEVVVTPANVPDFKAFDRLCPAGGMLFADKGYDFDAVYEEMKRNHVASGVIRRNNRKDKNRKLDKWRSSVRMPYEGIHNEFSRKTRYRGTEKTLFQKLMEAIAFNLRRLLRISEEILVPCIS